MRAVIKALGVTAILSLAILSWSGAHVFALESNAQAARQEEKNLHDQIRQAEQSGDKETAKSLREQLRAMHKENVGQRQQDQQGIKDSRQEWKSDKKAARQEKMDANGDGSVDKTERNQFRKQKYDNDNNPPGPRGGEGTNWENKPGPKGGPGASPDRRYHRRDNDNNPPGAKGGPGTNWENKPGPKGGPGASPDKKFHQNN